MKVIQIAAMFYKQIIDKLKKEADKRKLTKSDWYSWLIIVLLAIYIRFRGTFLTMFSDWWNLLSFCVVYLIVILLIYLLEKSIEYIRAVIISAIVFLCAWNTIYLYAYCNRSTDKAIHVTVPLNGYGTRPVHKVLFTYKGYKFEKVVNLKDVISKYGDNLRNICELELSLSEVDALPFFYYINYIDVVRKEKINDKSKTDDND